MSLYLQKMDKLRSGKTTSSNSATNQLSRHKSGYFTPSPSLSNYTVTLENLNQRLRELRAKEKGLKCTVTLGNLNPRQKEVRAKEKEALQAHIRRMELGRSLCHIKALPARQQLEELKVLQKNGHLDMAGMDMMSLHRAKSEGDEDITQLCESIIDSNLTMMSVELEEGCKPLSLSTPMFRQGTVDDQKTIKVESKNPAEPRRWSDASSISSLYVTATEDMLETSCVWES
jgi:hypothetical protein